MSAGLTSHCRSWSNGSMVECEDEIKRFLSYYKNLYLKFENPQSYATLFKTDCHLGVQ